MEYAKQWKCKKCNHFNKITHQEKRKADRDFTIANNTLIILSGGMWFLVMLIKECFLFGFDSGGGSSGNIISAEKQKDSCEACGAVKQ